jgi:putative NADH-flavin reductase
MRLLFAHLELQVSDVFRALVRKRSVLLAMGGCTSLFADNDTHAARMDAIDKLHTATALYTAEPVVGW